MLVLSRKIGEQIFIAEDIVIRVVAVDQGRALLGIEAPPHILILREELLTEEPPTPARLLPLKG